MYKSLDKIVHPVNGQILASKNQMISFEFLVNLYVAYGIEIFYLKTRTRKIRMNLHNYFNGGNYMVKI